MFYAYQREVETTNTVRSLECSDLPPEAEAEADGDGLDAIGVDGASESGLNPIRKLRVGSEPETCRGSAMPPANRMPETMGTDEG